MELARVALSLSLSLVTGLPVVSCASRFALEPKVNLERHIFTTYNLQLAGTNVAHLPS
jgi:hypothetical protein